MSWLVVTERTAQTMQPIVDDAPRAWQYCTDAFSTYEALNYHTGLHLVASGKSQTYSVEAGNAELRHYLARLARRSRCFTRSLAALMRNIALFVQCWNRRQLFKRAYPTYNPPLRWFASMWV